MNIGQSEVPTLEAIGQAFVVDPEQVQHGGVQVMDMDFVLHGTVAKFICCSPGKAGLDSTTCHPARKAHDMVVASRTLSHWRASKFSTPDDQCLIEHASLLQILD